MFDIKYTMNDDDYIAFQKDYFDIIRKKSIKKIVILLVCLALLAVWCIFEAVNSIMSGQTFFVVSYSVLAVFSSAIVIFNKQYSKAILMITVKKQLKKYKDDPKKPYGKTEVNFIFDDDGIKIKNEYTDNQMKYSVISDAVSTSAGIILLMNAKQGFFIPARAFESDEQREEFIKFIEKKIEENKQVN